MSAKLDHHLVKSVLLLKTLTRTTKQRHFSRCVANLCGLSIQKSFVKHSIHTQPKLFKTWYVLTFTQIDTHPSCSCVLTSFEWLTLHRGYLWSGGKNCNKFSKWFCELGLGIRIESTSCCFDFHIVVIISLYSCFFFIFGINVTKYFLWGG